MGILNTIGNITNVAGKIANAPMAIGSGAAYAISGGRIGSDITPSFSATNVARTQYNKVNSGNTGAVSNPQSITINDGGGDGNGGYSPAARTDPYAKFGGQAGYNNLRAGFTDQQNGVINSARTAANTSAGQRNLSILDFLDSLKTGQQGIEQKAINNERTRMQGLQGVRQSVGDGLRNTGQLLSARNAGGASVGGVIARDLGDQGRRQSGGIENDYELANMDVQNSQQALDTQRASGMRKFDFDRDNTVENIVSQAEGSLAQINQAMANASLTDRIALDAEKNRIRTEATQLLSQYDGQLQQGVAGIRANDVETRRGEANRLANLGENYDQSFQYDTDIPVELQGGGPFASELPLFTYRRNREA